MFTLEYAELTESSNLPRPRFIGAQPETLHKRHLSLIRKRYKYSITEKYDGERNELFISETGRAYLVNRRCRFRCSGLVDKYNKKTLLDEELVNGELFAFDILFIMERTYAEITTIF